LYYSIFTRSLPLVDSTLFELLCS
jgi:hypothetical protein